MINIFSESVVKRRQSGSSKSSSLPIYNDRTHKEIREAILYTIALISLTKETGISLMKQVKDSYNENFKTLTRK